MQKYKQLLSARLLKTPNLKDCNEIVEGTIALLSFDQKVKWASKCARSVLYIFEKTYPEDLRVRKCLDFLDSTDWENPTDEQIKSLSRISKAAGRSYDDTAFNVVAYGAVNADYARARAAADATGYAAYAAIAAIDATNATHTAARAAACAARVAQKAQGAAYATAYATSGTKKKQYKKNLQFLLEILINGK